VSQAAQLLQKAEPVAVSGGAQDVLTGVPLTRGVHPRKVEVTATSGRQAGPEAAVFHPGVTRVGDLAEGKPVTIGADDSVSEALQTMKVHGVRRLPVIDGHDLIGIVSQADIARNLPEDKVGDLVEAISAAPSNS
jgi:hypothetical protein